MAPFGNKGPGPMGRRVGRKASEYRVHLDEEDRRQLALDLVAELNAQKAKALLTFGELAHLWLARLRRVGGTGNERRHVEHLKPLHGLREGELTVASIDGVMLALMERLAPASLKKLKSAGKLIVDYAQSNGQWVSFNPFQKVRTPRVPKKSYTRLTLDELERAFLKLRPDRRRMARVSLWTGLRPGELLSITKSDVSFETGMINVHRSHERQETKTGRPRTVPIPRAVEADLREAMRVSPSDLVFPGPDGERQRRDTKLARMLKHGLRLAGICTSWRYACRKPGCGYKDELPDWQVRRPCPFCAWILHYMGVPRQFTYYDLRHACSTLHREAGADGLAVKMALGWAPRDQGDATYTHYSDAKLRAEMNLLGAQKHEKDTQS